jgi:hypothetical protein
MIKIRDTTNRRPLALEPRAMARVVHFAAIAECRSESDAVRRLVALGLAALGNRLLPPITTQP